MATLAPLKRKNIRQIISCRPNLYKKSSENEVFKDIIKIIDSSYLSHNHFVYSILMSIYEKKNNLNGILSESDIIENYIEILLSKHNFEPKPNTPSFNIIKNFCAVISFNMLVEKSKDLSEFKIYEIINKFNNETLNSYSASEYLVPLIKSEIIKRNERNIYSFGDDCFLSYFLAFHIKISPLKKGKLFNRENFLELGKTIEYYASQNSSSYEAFDFILGEIKNTELKISKEIDNLFDVDIDSFDITKIKEISFLDVASNMKELQESIEDHQSDQDKIDKLNDESMPLAHKREVKDLGDLKDSSEGDLKDDLFTLLEMMKKGIDLLARVFRNSDLVEDKDLTLLNFKSIISMNIFIMKCDLFLFDGKKIMPSIIESLERKKGFNNLNESEQKNYISKIEIFISLIRASIPNNIENSLSSNIISKTKRFKNILDEIKKTTSDDSNTFLIHLLLLESDKDNFSSNIKNPPKIKGKILKDAIFLKLTYLLMSSTDMKPSDASVLKNKIKSMYTNDYTKYGAIGSDLSFIED